MRKLLEVLRLKASGLSIRKIASSVKIARSTVGDYLCRMEEAGLSWPLDGEIDEEELERKLFDGPAVRGRDELRSLPDWVAVHVAIQERFLVLAFVSPNERGSAVAQPHAEQHHLLQNPSYHDPTVSPVYLGFFAGIEGQGKEHLALRRLAGRDVAPHRAGAALEAVLVPKPFEDALTRVALLPASALVLFQPGVDHGSDGIDLRTGNRLLAAIPRRLSMNQRLGYRLP